MILNSEPKVTLQKQIEPFQTFASFQLLIPKKKRLIDHNWYLHGKKNEFNFPPFFFQF